MEKITIIYRNGDEEYSASIEVELLKRDLAID